MCWLLVFSKRMLDILYHIVTDAQPWLASGPVPDTGQRIAQTCRKEFACVPHRM